MSETRDHGSGTHTRVTLSVLQEAGLKCDNVSRLSEVWQWCRTGMPPHDERVLDFSGVLQVHPDFVVRFLNSEGDSGLEWARRGALHFVNMSFTVQQQLRTFLRCCGWSDWLIACCYGAVARERPAGLLLPPEEPCANETPDRYTILLADGTVPNPAAVFFVLRLDEAADDLQHVAACREAAFAYVRAVRALPQAEHLLQKAEDIESLVLSLINGFE